MKEFLNLLSGGFFWMGLLGWLFRSSLDVYALFAFNKFSVDAHGYILSISTLVIAIAIRQIKMDYFPSR